MFDQLQKLSKLKGALKEARASLARQNVQVADDENKIQVTVRLDRVIEDITIDPDYLKSTEAGEVNRKLKETLNTGLEKAKIACEKIMQEEVGDLMPSFPGFNPKDIGFTS